MQQCDSTVVTKEQLSLDIVRLTLRAPDIAKQAKPGQFVNVKTAATSLDPLLRRPFSIHRTDTETLQIVFKILGKGTTALANVRNGDRVNLVGPLGNHYSVSENMCLIGGGLGIAPMAFLAQAARQTLGNNTMAVILGARTSSELLPFVDDFTALGITPLLATDDGTLGHHGLVTDLLSQLPPATKWQIRTCGPFPMMKQIATISRANGWPCQVSLETMMACGIKACLGCTVAASVPNDKGKQYLHVCQDGPVFEEGVIEWR